MTNKNKKALYEAVMRNVKAWNKKHINESFDDDFEDDDFEETGMSERDIRNLSVRDMEKLGVYDDDDEYDIDGTAVETSYGLCTVKACFDADKGDFYEVTDENGDFVCELPYNNNISSDDELIDAIEDEADFETGSGDYRDTDPLGYYDGSDEDDDLDDLDDYEDIDEQFTWDDCQYGFMITLQNGDVVYDSREFGELFDDEQDAKNACDRELNDIIDQQSEEEDGFMAGDYRTRILTICDAEGECNECNESCSSIDEDSWDDYDDESGCDKYSLVGIDGNAYSVMGYVKRAMRQEGMSRDEINAYLEDAMSSNYDHLLAVSINMIDELNNM